MKKLILLVLFFLIYRPIHGAAQSIPTLKTAGNSIISTQTLNTKLIVLNFWFIACGPCQKELKNLLKLATKYKDNKNILFISISSMDDAEQLLFLDKYKHFGYQLIPKNKTVIDQFDINLFPTNIISYKGETLFRLSGYNDEVYEKMDKEITKALNEHNI